MRKAKTVCSERVSAPSDDDTADSLLEVRADSGKQDSAATDVGVPPLPEEEVCKKHSALVREHITRRQRYVPGRERSRFFRDPAVGLRCSGPDRPQVPAGARPRVDRYHYNHYGWREDAQEVVPQVAPQMVPQQPPCYCLPDKSSETLPGLFTAKVNTNTNQRFVFKAVDGGDKSMSVAGNVHKTDLLKDPRPQYESPQQPIYQSFDSRPDRIDIYLFDHQDPRYLQTTDNPPPIKTEAAAYAVEDMAVRIWAEFYGVLHFPVAVVTAFVVQTLKFLMVAIVRPLVTGILQTLADYLLKPLLTVLFNGYLQPILILLYNLATSFRDLCRPIAAGLGYFVAEAAALIAAFRLVEVRSRTSNGPFFVPPRRSLMNV